jgi:hypothetical protein
MENNFFKLPDVPLPWNLLDDWSNEENSQKHGITKTEISSVCFYYLEVLTDLLQKYGNHYSFDKLPEELQKLSPDPALLDQEIHNALFSFHGRTTVFCPTFQTFSINKVRELLIREFLTVPPTDEKVEICASYAIKVSLIQHIDWVFIQISNWIRQNDTAPHWIIDNMQLYVERNWRKIPKDYFIRTVDQMFGLVYRMTGIPGYVYGSIPTTIPIPKVLKDMVHTLQTESILKEHQQWFAAQLHYRIGGPKPPPDEDEEED